MKIMTLIPAYGRDYKAGASLLSDWAQSKDFLIASYGHPFDGKPINKDAISALKLEGYTHVQFRFQQLRKIKVVAL